MPRSPELYLIDIVESAAEVAGYLSGLGPDQFLASRAIRMAVFGELIVVGEAAANIPADLRARHPDIEWARVVGLRNVLAHQYFDIDWDAVWETATVHLRRLREQVESVLRAEFPLAAEALDRKNGES